MVNTKKVSVLLIAMIAGVTCQPPEYPGRPQYVHYHDQYDEGSTNAKQGFTLAAILTPLISTVFLPLLSNLGNGLTNAITATFANRRLAILPMDRMPMPLRNNDVNNHQVIEKEPESR